ncbi:unnamed protein product [Lactuca virosa]|uniref:Uncharacterized protein n=1 Tax=Lactuca virosa TaxID=75947 RepID=A0AAU9MY05_9ASTR|nr:unnamed protein product [Lactuca virosa]
MIPSYIPYSQRQTTVDFAWTTKVDHILLCSHFHLQEGGMTPLLTRFRQPPYLYNLKVFFVNLRFSLFFLVTVV